MAPLSPESKVLRKHRLALTTPSKNIDSWQVWQVWIFASDRGASFRRLWSLCRSDQVQGLIRMSTIGSKHN
jgi:hypothetical protein